MNYINQLKKKLKFLAKIMGSLLWKNAFYGPKNIKFFKV